MALNDTLYPGQKLTSGTSLTSADGRFVVTMQGDGNLVLTEGGQPVWSSQTQGHPGAVLINQADDGNMVIVAPGNVPVWSTQTNGHPSSTFVVQSDRNAVVYNPDRIALWQADSYLR